MSQKGRFILRAELTWAMHTAITYGFDLTPSSIFVVTDWRAPADTAISLRLSFPRVLDPIMLTAKVVDATEAGAPGELAGLRLAFEPAAPIVALLARLQEPAAAAEPAAPPYRVLLVEDNRLIRDVFSHGFANFFQKAGAFVVDHAASAEAAWTMLTETAYDLAIIDHILPAANGATLITRLRNDPRTARLAVVAISVGGSDARDATIAAGADLFVDKPLVFRDLFSTLRILWERRGTIERKSILVLDDSHLALDLARSVLESAGFEVATADDLATFDARRTSVPPDLILVDVQMPEAFGDDIVAMLRDGHGVTIPIVLLSSLEETELARRAAEAAAAGYVCKGAGATALVRKCRELLGVA